MKLPQLAYRQRPNGLPFSNEYNQYIMLSQLPLESRKNHFYPILNITEDHPYITPT